MRKIININQGWAFTKDNSAVPTCIKEEYEKVNLPHCWNAIDGQDGGNDYFRGTCLYKRVLSKNELPITDEYFLEINGANASASVYLNG